MHDLNDVSAARPENGLVLGDRYRLERCIAVGGMGEVWEARDQILGRTVAVKVLKDEFVDSPEFIERFRNEARHTAALSHPGIACVFDYGETDRWAYLVMELVHGETLSHRLARGPRLSVASVLSILATTAEALHAAHVRGVVHRDVKPGNLMLLDDGSVKVTDFGIARAVDAIPITAVGQVVGTARYMSPEQALGQPIRAASDVYSLGVIGFEMLAGHPPFVADSPIALARAHIDDPPPPLPDSVPASVRSMIGQALSKAPQDRQPSAATFAAEAREQLRLLANGATAVHDERSPTQIVRANAPATTRRMPAGGVKVGAPIVLVDKHALVPRRRVALVVALTAILAIVGLTAFALSTRDHGLAVDSTTSTAATTTSTSATTELLVATTLPALVTVDPSVLLGQQADDAQQLLEALGLSVRSETARSDLPEGTVTSVEPTGGVAPGSLITLFVSDGEGNGRGKHKGNGGGND
jgi:eukaryotic-like serine/threonine-protein kinase